MPRFPIAMLLTWFDKGKMDDRRGLKNKARTGMRMIRSEVEE
jgi:hypothetical protein